jgi:hypothetical protein
MLRPETYVSQPSPTNIRTAFFRLALLHGPRRNLCLAAREKMDMDGVSFPVHVHFFELASVTAASRRDNQRIGASDALQLL